MGAVLIDGRTVSMSLVTYKDLLCVRDGLKISKAEADAKYDIIKGKLDEALDKVENQRKEINTLLGWRNKETEIRMNLHSELSEQEVSVTRLNSFNY